MGKEIEWMVESEKTRSYLELYGSDLLHRSIIQSLKESQKIGLYLTEMLFWYLYQLLHY